MPRSMPLPRPGMLRLAAILLPALLLLGACGGASGGGGGGGGSATPLTTLAGPVIGYSFPTPATLQAFSPMDGSQLAAGTLSASAAAATMNANLTPIGLIPGDAFGYFAGCGGVSFTPSSVGITAVVALGVADSLGLFGALFHTSAANPRIGDRVIVYFAATGAATISGSCIADGVLSSYEMSLRRGWNPVEVTITNVDLFGNPIALGWRSVSTVPSDVRWTYLPLDALLLDAQPRSGWWTALPHALPR
jgi:hypothetical protein